MLPLSVSDLVRAVQGLLVLGDPVCALGGPVAADLKAPGVSIDSRTVRRGDVFFAIKGERFDGNDFLNDAVRKGAAACVASRLPEKFILPAGCSAAIVLVKDTRRALGDLAASYRKRYGGAVRSVAVAGSCGKSTVKEMAAQILAGSAPTVYSQGNLNNDIGCPLSVLAISNDYAYGVFELGASARGEVRRLAEIVKPQVAVVTNIRLEHTATFGTLEDIAEGESEILSALAAGGTAVLPCDDPYFAFLRGRIPADLGAGVLSFGLSDRASVYAKDISTWPGPSRFTLVRQDGSGKVLGEVPCRLPVPGRFNVLNACAAAAACLSLGLPLEKIQSGLENFRPLPLRFQVLNLEDDVIVVNDAYNANPGSMRTAVEGFVESFSSRKLCLVLSDMLELGEISSSEHAALGKFLAGFPLYRVVLYGPQSRFTWEGAKSLFMKEDVVRYCRDREDLKAEVQKILAPGTAVLFKASRAMRLEEIVKAVTERQPAEK